MYKMPVPIVKKIHNDNELLEIMKNEFLAKYAKNFVYYSELSLKQWAKILPISLRTLQRDLQNENKKFDLAVSESFIEIGEIFDLGLKAFDNEKERLNEWLNTENIYFNNKRPLDIMDTHKGRELVKDELMSIEYGEFS